ncbi:MAG: hypothetical protein R3250_02295 [Melioribacteraceae bacterium]|nr:hypothetical protein [Melioribacteraceae bacterium]
MKRLILIPIIIFLLQFAINAEAIQHNDMTSQYEMTRGICRQIMNLSIDFISKNDFYQPYTHEYYKPLIIELGELIWKFDREMILDRKYGIIMLDIKVIGNPIGDRIPQFVFIHVFFKMNNWLLKIRIKGKNEREI